MKQGLMVALAVFMSHTVNAQQFSFEMYFEDALGNMDTIVLGYDTSATLGIDTAFAELEISDQPKDTAFDVRIVQYSHYTSAIDTVVTKKQIVPLDCDNAWPHIITDIEITTDNWPVTANWDNTLFNDTCRRSSLFTSVNPGGWFDTGSPSDLDIVNPFLVNNVVFSSQVSRYNGSISVNENYAHLDPLGDTVSVFWFTFNYDLTIGVGAEPVSADPLVLFPNPATDRIVFSDEDKVRSIVCYSTEGARVAFELNGNEADISTLPAGVYYLHIELDNDLRVTKRFVKQ